MFSQPESARISDAYVAVRLLGGNDLDDEGRAFAQRYGVRGFPTLLALSPDGAVLNRSFQRSLEGILGAMQQAATTQAAFEKTEAALRDRTDAGSIRTLARLYRDRMQYEAARKAYGALASHAQVADHVELLSVLQAVGDKAAEKALLSRLIEEHPTDPRAIEWRIARALSDVPTQFASREERAAAQAQSQKLLTSLLETVGSPAEQAMVRLHLARILNSTRDREAALAHWEWILEHARDSAAAPEALMQTAGALFRGARGDVELLEEVQGLLQEVVDKHPDHPAAADARRYIVAVAKTIEKTKADAKADDGSTTEGDS